METISKIAIVVIVVLSLSLVGVLIYGAVGPAVTFERNVHSYMDNAYWASDPVTMKEQLVRCRQGMVDLGLTPNLYAAFWPWDKVPKNSMAWQYQHMDSLLSRTDEFIAWEKEQAGGNSAQVKDVYTEKLNNMRSFLQEGGWSDGIAHNAFFLNNYLWLVLLQWTLAGLTLIAWIGGCVLGIVVVGE